MFDWLKKLFPPAPPVDPNAPPPEPKPGVPVTFGPKWVAYLKYAMWVAAVVIGIGTFVMQWKTDGKIPDKWPDIPPFPQQPAEVVRPVGQGWVQDDAAVQAILGTLPEGERRFADTPAGKAVLGPDEDVYLWDYARKATGDRLPPRDQGSVGSCVSFGTAAAIEHLLCVQIVNGGGGEFRPLAQEVIYAGSRVEVGGGRLRGDGSIGAWAAQFVQQWGVVGRGQVGKYDLSAYSESRCRSWGNSGVPDDLEPVAKESPVKGVALVQSAAEAKKALRQGYPIAVCSDQGFSMTRGSDGFANPQGSWAHCMAIIGYTAGPREGFYILNSWGPDAHRGPTGKGDPGTAGFWADYRVVDRMLSQGDSWAFSDAKGWPARRLDWFAAGQQLRHMADARPQRRAPADPLGVFALAP